MIHSFAFYIENAVASFLAKGVTPIISSVTPDNIWSGTTIAPGGRFVTYAKSIGTRRNIVYVDHFAYVAQAYGKLGQTQTTTFYPIDHLHTSPAGALVVAQAFVRGLLCGTSTLKSKVNAAGQAVPSMSPFSPATETQDYLTHYSRWLRLGPSTSWMDIYLVEFKSILPFSLSDPCCTRTSNMWGVTTKSF